MLDVAVSCAAMVPIICSLIGTAGVIIVAVVQQGRKTRNLNTAEHGLTATSMGEVLTAIGAVDSKVDGLNDRLTKLETKRKRR